MPRSLLARLTGRPTRTTTPAVPPVPRSVLARLTNPVHTVPSTTSPMIAAVDADEQAARARATDALRAAAGPHLIAAATTQGATHRPQTEPSHILDAVLAPNATTLTPGRYAVTYGRLGAHGRHGTPKPAPLTTSRVLDVAELAAAITADATRYADAGTRVEVFIDLQVAGGHIHIAGTPAGTFEFFPATTHDGATTA